MTYSLSNKQKKLVQFLFISSFFLIGVLPEFIACIYTGIEGLFLIYLYHKNIGIRTFDNFHYIMFIFIVFMYFFTILYAIDRVMSGIGFLSMVSTVLFLLIMMQLTADEKNELLECIPLCGIIMILVCILSWFTKFGMNYFFVSGRMGGFFQYPNTFGLFLLLGVIILLNKKELLKKDYVYFLIIISGILLTGSRTIYVLTLLFLIYFSFKNRQILYFFIAMMIFLVVLVISNHVFHLNISVIDRLSSIDFSESTFLGRLLYYKDGLLAAIKHPFGLGYLGYYFIEGQIQTGVYSIRFIHNDFLQIILDVGLIPGIMFMVIVLRSLFSTHTNKLYKQLIIAIALHSLFDFSLQYKSIMFILIIVLDFYSGTEKVTQSHHLMPLKVTATCIMSLLVFYLSFSLSFYYLGMTALSLKFMPFYTEALTEALASTDNVDEGYHIANRLKSINSHIPVVYDVLAVYEYQQQDYNAMVEYKEKSVNLQKYNMEAYDNYIMMLNIAIQYYYNTDQYRSNMYIQKLLDVPDKINQIRNETSSLAYKIKDQPDFSLSDQSIQILQLYSDKY